MGGQLLAVWMGMIDCLSTWVLYLWAVKDSGNNAEFWMSPYEGCRRIVFPASWLTTKAAIVGWRPLQIWGYLCQFLFCADAVALAVLALSICRMVLIWSGLDVHIFYLDSLDSSQMLPFLQWDLFFPLCLAAYIFKNLYKHSHPPKLTGRFISSCRVTSSSALSIRKLNAKGLEQVEGCSSQNWTSTWDAVSPEPSMGHSLFPSPAYNRALLAFLEQDVYHMFRYRKKMRTKSSSAWSWWEWLKEEQVQASALPQHCGVILSKPLCFNVLLSKAGQGFSLCHHPLYGLDTSHAHPSGSERPEFGIDTLASLGSQGAGSKMSVILCVILPCCTSYTQLSLVLLLFGGPKIWIFPSFSLIVFWANVI